jgi:hypothetical protein
MAPVVDVGMHGERAVDTLWPVVIPTLHFIRSFMSSIIRIDILSERPAECLSRNSERIPLYTCSVQNSGKLYTMPERFLKPSCRVKGF